MLDRYEISCPNGHTTVLPGKTLRRIVANLRHLDRGSRRITFVCWQCKTPFPFDCPKTQPAEGTDAPSQSLAPFFCIVEARCGDARCGFPVEFVAIGERDAGEEVLHQRFYAEFRAWDKRGLLCERNHSVPSDPTPEVRFL
jgi:hypothetical protein